jgi:hypothetical protein
VRNGPFEATDFQAIRRLVAKNCACLFIALMMFLIDTLRLAGNQNSQKCAPAMGLTAMTHASLRGVRRVKPGDATPNKSEGKIECCDLLVLQE